MLESVRRTVMEEQKEIYGMLDLMIRPGFCVKENKIVKLNQAAEGLFLAPGTDIQTLLLTGAEEYAAFESGCLYLQLALAGQECGASVTRVDGMDVFVLDQESDQGELRAMALAARELREPLNNLIAITDNLLPRVIPDGDAKVSSLLARMSRGLYQMQRILGNMSDAGRSPAFSQQETRNVGHVFDDIFEKAGALVTSIGIQIHYEGLQEEIHGLVDAQQMERAVLNILSNAIKFMPQGGTIDAKLTRRGSILQLSVLDSGSGIAENVRSNVFSRYLRQPVIEDSRYGIGLGMVLIRAAAAHHGGTVLIDQPGEKGTRVTMTMKLRQNETPQVHTLLTDITGGRDQGLIELSGCLPVSIYEKEK